MKLLLPLHLALLVLLLAATFSLPSLADVEHTNVSTQRLLNANQETSNWLSHGMGYDESRFSPLKQINTDTVKQLDLAWSFKYPDIRGLEATPIVVDGVIYTTGSWSRVYSHNAKTGELLWSFDPKVDKAWLVRACCGPVNRGVAVWQDKVYVGTLDGYLIAIDRETGLQVWRTLTIDPDEDYTITGAPRVVNGQVLIGNGGAEYGVRGYISAYDANTGDMNWRFYTVPGNPADGFDSDAMEKAAVTWKGEWWLHGGGGTVWDSMAYDPELNLLYIGVGNGSPWNQQIRSPGGGDNLYLSSIVALNPDTGNYVWHYQTTPGESWDFTATQQMVLADINWQGETRQVIMQAPKNGFFFIIDRVTGEYLSAEPFTKVVWAEAYDDTGRPIEIEGMRYKDKAALLMPGAIGGHNWHSMSYSKKTGLMYIPVIKGMMQYAQPENHKHYPHHLNVGADLSAETLINPLFMQKLREKSTRGELLAWNPETQTAEWSFTHATGWNGGVLSTAGDVVFQGTADQKLMAFDANSGALLWQYNTKLGIVAAPISYSVDGEQYVAIAAKWGGGYPLAVGVKPPRGLDNGRLLVFKLGGQASLPEPDMPTLLMANKPPVMTITDAAALKEGAMKYQELCSGCHGSDGVAGGNVPDLRYSASQYSFETFKLFVLEGVRASEGMVGFKDVLDETGADKIYNYILQQAQIEYEKNQNKGIGQDIEFFFYDALATFFIAAAERTTGFYMAIASFWATIIGLIVVVLRRRRKHQQ